ncbi:MAG: hypothetical protein L3J56_10740 [Bacteroidales bacterium]|nr:hypothetical protein [Bacteroidales bacterium]
MAKKKSKLFKSKAEIKKSLQNSIMESVVAAGSGVATSFVYTAVKDKIPDKFQKFGGVGIIAAGTGLNIYAKDPLVKAAANGIVTAGGVHTVNELGDDKMKAKLGLSLQGLGNTETDNTDKISEEELRQIEKEMSENLDNEEADKDMPAEVPGLNEE